MPTAAIRFLVGDVWWWVPLVLCAVGFLGLSWLSIVEWGWLGTCFGLVILAAFWAGVSHLYMRVLRDELCLRRGLPSVIWWWIVAHVGWFLPGAPLWTVLDHHGEAESPFADRLRLWVNSGGHVRGLLERWSIDGAGDATRTSTDLGGAAGVELLAALEEFREAGFPWDDEGGMVDPPTAHPTTTFLRRGCQPASRWGPSIGRWNGLGRFWAAWHELLAGPGPLGLMLDSSVPRVSIHHSGSLGLGDLVAPLRDRVGRIWEVRSEQETKTTSLCWPDRGLRVEFDAAGQACAFELRAPADGFIRLDDDQSVPMSFVESCGSLVSALTRFAADRGLKQRIEGDALIFPSMGVRFAFDRSLPVGAAGELALRDAAAVRFPTLRLVTIGRPAAHPS